MATGLERLNQQVKKDLACLCYPPANWVPARQHAAVEQVYDVVVVGAGMCGLVAGFALLAAGISNIRILDRSPAGFEGPWINYARMETLRSPKHLTGPAYGIPSLTFRAWYEAQFGDQEWQLLDKIPRPVWMDYLRWYRQILQLPVENQIEVISIESDQQLLRLHLSGQCDSEPFIITRKVVLATGREGPGPANIPDFVEGLNKDYWAHSSETIDFVRLCNKRVVVVGVGSSAVDNAAEALEAGAAEVRLLSRRQEMPRINKLMGIGTHGFNAGFAGLNDDWRWRFMHYAHITQTPAPHGSTLRVSRHNNAYFHFAAEISSLSQSAGEINIDTVRGVRFVTDFIILGTGFIVDLSTRQELANTVDQILLWRDRYTPAADLQHQELARFPYLSADFSFQERQPGTKPWLQNIHFFNHGATLSLGKISGDIPAISDGARVLVQAIAAGFYRDDIDYHWQFLQNYDKPELLGDEWQVASDPP